MRLCGTGECTQVPLHPGIWVHIHIPVMHMSLWAIVMPPVSSARGHLQSACALVYPKNATRNHQPQCKSDLGASDMGMEKQGAWRHGGLAKTHPPPAAEAVRGRDYVHTRATRRA